MLDFMLQGIAPGIADSWDLQPNPSDPDFYEEWYAVAQALKWSVKDRIDQLRTERNPATAVEKLQDYELALGLLQTSAAQFGTVAQRQGQVVGRFRESGGLTKFSLQTVMQPYLRYADPKQIRILEPDRAALKAAHTYAYPYTYPLALATPIYLFVNVPENSFVSDSGAQLYINVQVAGSGTSAIVELTDPEGLTRRWDLIDYRAAATVVGMNTVFDLVLYATDFAPRLADDGYTVVRRKAGGSWTLTLKYLDQLNAASLFVEGVGRDRFGRTGLGEAMFEWAVFAESAKLGAGSDLFGALAAIRRMNHCHLNGNLYLDGLLVNSVAAIPDDPGAIPDEALPG